MLKVEKIATMNMDNAIRGARNPLNSWSKSDSFFDENGTFILGENDLSLARSLAKAGSDHRKFLRQIFVSMDITAPLLPLTPLTDSSNFLKRKDRRLSKARTKPLGST